MLFKEILDFHLPPQIAALREKALALHQERGTYLPPIPELTLIDAQAWATHAERAPADVHVRMDDTDWLIWRARRCAARLNGMPLDLEPGECIVGKPRFRDPLAAELEELESARQVLASMPPFPGGDAGHFHPDFEKLFRLGVGGILAEIEDRRAACDAPPGNLHWDNAWLPCVARAGQREPDSDTARRAFYDACRIALEGMSTYMRRVGDACVAMAAQDAQNQAMSPADAWHDLAAICHRVATQPPRTFHEAIQLMFMTQIALWFGEDHPLTCPGRMDQTLRPFYEADLAAGRIARPEAWELICCLYIQLNRILHTGSALAVMVGGRDGQGQDATNELTYLCLAARLATSLSYPTVAIAWHEGTPPELMDFAVQMLACGKGDPAFFNDALIVEGLRDHGVREEDAYNHMNSTCVEIKVVGRSNMWVTQPYFNLPKGLLEVLAQVARGDLPAPATYDELAARVRQDLAGKVRQAAQQLDQTWRERARHGCFPLASCLIQDCLERGLDFDRGGARYNWVENSFVGLANLVDSLIAVRHLVYERGELTLAQLYQVLQDDFQGHEALRWRILNRLPKYGNDQPEADQVAGEWATFLIATTESNVVGLHRYVPGFFCWIMHERMGSQTGATPDGRCAFWPLADGAGAAQGREKSGPTASVLSTTTWSHRRALGGLVHNAKFGKRLFHDEQSRSVLRQVIETYLRRGGFEIQVNVVDKETLLAAQAHPEQHSDLLVRVAGYSDYFVQLNAKMQEEIIARTEHEI